MPLALSVVPVFGAVGIFVGNLVFSQQGELGLGFEQMIHARIPWLLLTALLGGAGLGIWSLARKRRWYKWVIVSVELCLAILLTFYFTSVSFLPGYRLALSVGDPFPSYSLVDQDGNRHTFEATGKERAALYIFYRGDW